MKTPRKVSIIIPLYNARPYVRACVESCLAQTYQNIEIIVIDDGSTDHSAAALSGLRSSIRYVRQPNFGASTARNYGLTLATGDYVYFLDADDLLHKNSIELLVHALEKGSSDLAIGNYETIDQSGTVVKQVSAFSENSVITGDQLSALFAIYPNPSTKLFRRRIITKNHLTFADLRLAQDLNFYFKYLLCCHSVSVTTSNIYQHRLTPGSISHTYDDRLLDLIKSFDDVQAFATDKNLQSYYSAHLNNVKLMHLSHQLHKTRAISDTVLKNQLFAQLKSEFLRTPKNPASPTYQKTRPYIRKTRFLLHFGRFYLKVRYNK